MIVIHYFLLCHFLKKVVFFQSTCLFYLTFQFVGRKLILFCYVFNKWRIYVMLSFLQVVVGIPFSSLLSAAYLSYYTFKGTRFYICLFSLLDLMLFHCFFELLYINFSFYFWWLYWCFPFFTFWDKYIDNWFCLSFFDAYALKAINFPFNISCIL